MSNLRTYQNEVYYQYLAIEEKAYHEKIKFIKANQGVITKLEGELMVEIMTNYALALNEVNNNLPAIKLCDELIAYVIDKNIYSVEGKNIFHELLALKAVCLYKEKEAQKAEHVFKELIKMNPERTDYRIWLNRVLALKNRNEEQKIRAFCILLFLSAGAIIGIELFIVRPFYPEFTSFIEWIRNTCFISGCVLYLGYNYLKKYRVQKAISKIL